MAVSYKTQHLLPHDPATVLLGIDPKDLKTYDHIKGCTRIFTAALYMIVKTWNLPRCPSVDKWVNKLIYSGNRTLFIAKKKWAIKP